VVVSNDYDSSWERATGWLGLEFGEGDYLDHEQLAMEAEREESQEIEDFWAMEQLKQELYGDDMNWDTDYEKRKSKARWRHWDYL
jgi:hypothetical protein